MRGGTTDSSRATRDSNFIAYLHESACDLRTETSVSVRFDGTSFELPRTRLPCGGNSIFRQLLAQFALNRVCDLPSRRARKSVQHQFFDVHFDLARIHFQPPSSVWVSGFSSFSYSRRAAPNKCGIRTGSSASAAANAALSAMLRMLPPEIERRARRSISSESIGVLVGKILRQISARCA